MKTQNKRKHFWFVKIPTDLLFDDEISAEEKVLYAAFYRYASDKGEFTLGRSLGIEGSQINFQLAMQKLKS